MINFTINLEVALKMPVAAFPKGRPDFDRLKNESNKLILMKVSAPHCNSCDTLRPVLCQLATEQNGNFNLVEIDMNEEPDLAIDLGIRSVPTVVLFKGDRLLEKIVGLQSKQLYLATIRRWVYQIYQAELE
jgi:thioredoxin 1